jgi:hypothetical protein
MKKNAFYWYQNIISQKLVKFEMEIAKFAGGQPFVVAHNI